MRIILAVLILGSSLGADRAKFDAYRARMKERRRHWERRVEPRPTAPKKERLTLFRPIPMGMDRASFFEFVRKWNEEADK